MTRYFVTVSFLGFLLYRKCELWIRSHCYYGFISDGVSHLPVTLKELHYTFAAAYHNADKSRDLVAGFRIRQCVDTVVTYNVHKVEIR